MSDFDWSYITDAVGKTCPDGKVHEWYTYWTESGPSMDGPESIVACKACPIMVDTNAGHGNPWTLSVETRGNMAHELRSERETFLKEIDRKLNVVMAGIQPVDHLGNY